MQKKIAFLLSALWMTVCITIQACHKTDNTPDPTPGPAGNNPTLPAVPFNYTNQQSEIPAYLLNFIQNNPLIDNTPSNNPITNEGATLGRVLFYDKNLSVNNTISCGSCHHQDKGFADPKAFSIGFDGISTHRNSMPIFNIRYYKAKKMFWDLRADNLETQTLMPIQDHIEMGMPSLTILEQKLRQVSYYPDRFKSAFGTTDITSDRISKALSQFVRSIISFNSKYDQGLANNFANFTQEELRGKGLIKSLNCTECHSDLTTIAANNNPTFFIVENSGVNTGNGSNNALDVNYTDKGIGDITHLPKDDGTFKMPSLRNVELTAPYMHDGRFTTLGQVIEHYATGAKNHANRGVQIPNGGYSFLTQQNKSDLVAFLKTLTDHSLAANPKYANPF